MIMSDSSIDLYPLIDDPSNGDGNSSSDTPGIPVVFTLLTILIVAYIVAFKKGKL